MSHPASACQCQFHVFCRGKLGRKSFLLASDSGIKWRRLKKSEENHDPESLRRVRGLVIQKLLWPSRGNHLIAPQKLWASALSVVVSRRLLDESTCVFMLYD